ncbi:probable galacturonosyltransferase 3 [Elaeis guineensis]|uniref:Hexosyltransferase n=1 Tax=Elaeis guineensis var. tenera TaxID=51953 RepID=A0A6J0PHD6_ELAGV|nr:probable galacturonosyltransferase 3 [Elaeis guineensis]
MACRGDRCFSSCGFLLLLWCFEVWNFACAVRSETSEMVSIVVPDDSTGQRDGKGYRRLQGCPHCMPGKDVEITIMYADASGSLKVHKVNSKDLSASWMWKNNNDEIPVNPMGGLWKEGSFKPQLSESREKDQPSADQHQQAHSISSEKLKRLELRQKRKQKRTAELIQLSKDAELRMKIATVDHSLHFNNTLRRHYSIWRRDHRNHDRDSTLKLMKDQIIMAKVYASIARSMKNLDLFGYLMNRIKENQNAIREANSDAELQKGALEYVEAMARVLSFAKEHLYDCSLVARKLRAMAQSLEETIIAQQKKNQFLMQFTTTKIIPTPLHCLPLQLTTDYFQQDHTSKELADKAKLEDPSLYHYAIFSDNVLATAVVVNSTILHVKEPGKHIFHIVTDRMNFAAMKMWFIAHPPLDATVHVENFDEFKWINSSYCPVLHQIKSENLKQYYFRADHPSTLSAGDENLKYKNPKYLSMLNHLRFYMPEIFPKLDKILFLDDDVIVQKDLTPLWSIDMKGMVNGAVETCKGSFHQFNGYLNFSDPVIADNFDPKGCGWAFGMNILDLKEWKKRDITGIYHYWQNLNKDRNLWKLGTLPAGLVSFYGLTYALDRSWHVLGLGYNPQISPSDIEKAAVIHYNGNYKPWLDLAMTKYRHHWTKYVNLDNPYLRVCNIVL